MLNVESARPRRRRDKLTNMQSFIDFNPRGLHFRDKKIPETWAIKKTPQPMAITGGDFAHNPIPTNVIPPKKVRPQKRTLCGRVNSNFDRSGGIPRTNSKYFLQKSSITIMHHYRNIKNKRNI